MEAMIDCLEKGEDLKRAVHPTSSVFDLLISYFKNCFVSIHTLPTFWTYKYEYHASGYLPGVSNNIINSTVFVS